MGELNKTTLGRVRGLVGDVVFRQRDGVNYVSSRPGEYPETTDPVILARRDKFKLTLKFASSINSIDYLREMWKPYSPAKGIGYNTMVRTNYAYINKGVISERASLVPVRGFAVNITSMDLSSTELKAALEALGTGTGINESVERNIYLAAIVHFSNPVVEADKSYEFISLLSVPQSIDLVNPLNFSILLDSVEGQIFKAYQTNKIFATLFTVDANDKPAHFSSTFVK